MTRWGTEAMSWGWNWLNDPTDTEDQRTRQLLSCWGCEPAPYLVGNHYHFTVRHSVSWHLLSAQALWFYLSFSFRPAFHRYSWVFCSCLHSEMVPVESSELFYPGHTWSRQIFHRTEGAPLQISASVLSKAPRRHIEASRVLKSLWFHVFEAQRMFRIWLSQMPKMYKPRWFQNLLRLGVTPKPVSPNENFLQSSWISTGGAQQLNTPSDC